MRLWRPVAILLVCVLLFGTVSCGGTPGYSIEVPASLRSRAASDFPEFEIVEAEGSTSTGASEPGQTEQDVIFTLKHRRLAFYMTRQYDQIFRQGETPPGWTLSADGYSRAAPSLRGELDPRARSFVAFFADRYPGGRMIYQGPHDLAEPTRRHRFTAWLYPRSQPGIVGCTPRIGRAETYVYDPDSGRWSAR